MSNTDRLLLIVAIVVLFHAAETVRPVVPKVSQALDDFHAVTAKAGEATEAVRELRESIDNFKFPKIFSEQQGASRDQH